MKNTKIAFAILIVGLVSIPSVSANMHSEMNSGKIEMKEQRMENKENKEEMKKEYKKDKAEMKKEYKTKRVEMKMRYKKAFAKKLGNRLDKISNEKLEKIVMMIDLKLSTIEENTKLSDSKKERLIAIYSAIKDLIQNKVDAINHDASRSNNTNS